MDVTLEIHGTLDDALDLVGDLERYALAASAEFRDDPPPPGTGDRLLRRALEAPEGVVLTARESGSEQTIGMCLTGPLVDPLVGDSLPMVLVLEVHPDYRHRGLAGAMVRRVRQELAERGYGVLAARAGHNDDALISMGERWGFVRSWEVMVREER